MTNIDQPHAVYRYRGKRNELLYIGRSNDPVRRAGEHTRSKPWITSTTRIDLEWVPPELVAEVEKRAIESEHPLYNIQHNAGRIRVEVSAEVSVRSPADFAALLALSYIAGLTIKWGFEAAANWSVRRRAERAGMPVDLPPVKNPFAGGGPEGLQALVGMAAMPPDELQRKLALYASSRAAPSASG